MSRAFVKEQDVVAELPDRIIPSDPNDVTKEGMKHIEAALRRAQKKYDDACKADNATAKLTTARDVRYWTKRRSTARIVPATNEKGIVRFGTVVTIRRDDGREQTYKIVGQDEADPNRGSISHVSPLAKALFGKRVGEVVRAGTGQVEITAIC